MTAEIDQGPQHAETVNDFDPGATLVTTSIVTIAATLENIKTSLWEDIGAIELAIEEQGNAIQKTLTEAQSISAKFDELKNASSGNSEVTGEDSIVSDALLQIATAVGKFRDIVSSDIKNVNHRLDSLFSQIELLGERAASTATPDYDSEERRLPKGRDTFVLEMDKIHEKLDDLTQKIEHYSPIGSNNTSDAADIAESIRESKLTAARVDSIEKSFLTIRVLLGTIIFLISVVLIRTF